MLPLALLSCQPRVSAIQTAIAQTEAADRTTASLIQTAIAQTQVAWANIGVGTTAADAASVPTSGAGADACSVSNPVVSNWLRDTDAADALTISGQEAALDLYMKPRDSGKREAEDWERRTHEAYDLMKEYQPVPSCLSSYHRHVTETLLQLSLSFSEIRLDYVAMDSGEDFRPHLSATKAYMAAVLEASEASVDEWNRLQGLGLPSP